LLGVIIITLGGGKHFIIFAGLGAHVGAPLRISVGAHLRVRPAPIIFATVCLDAVGAGAALCHCAVCPCLPPPPSVAWNWQDYWLLAAVLRAHPTPRPLHRG